jgi:hypothetical protein
LTILEGLDQGRFEVVSLALWLGGTEVPEAEQARARLAIQQETGYAAHIAGGIGPGAASTPVG